MRRSTSARRPAVLRTGTFFTARMALKSVRKSGGWSGVLLQSELPEGLSNVSPRHRAYLWTEGVSAASRGLCIIEGEVSVLHDDFGIATVFRC